MVSSGKPPNRNFTPFVSIDAGSGGFPNLYFFEGQGGEISLSAAGSNP